MSKKTLIAAFGVAAGLAVAAMPAAGVFADPVQGAGDPVSASQDVDVKVKIGAALTLECTTADKNNANNDYVEMTAGDTNSDLQTKCKVVTNANKGYNLTVIDKDANTYLDNGNTTLRDSDKIVANAAAGTAAGWSLTSDSTATQTGMTTSPFAIAASNGSASMIHWQSTPTDDSGNTTTITYNFQTRADQAAGDYKDTIVYTATANV